MCSHIHTFRYDMFTHTHISLHIYITYKLRIVFQNDVIRGKPCYIELARINRNFSPLSAEPMHCWQSQKVSRERYYILRARVYMFVCVVYAYVGMYVYLPVDRMCVSYKGTGSSL